MKHTGAPERLEALLQEARRRSLIGPAPIGSQLAHAKAFLCVLLLEEPGGPVLELGSGGGLPGLALSVWDQRMRLTLLDSSIRSAEYLRWAVAELGVRSRVEVVNARAEDLGRDEAYRARFAAVIARSFGPPAVTAECAAPFLRSGGRLIVAEPPAGVGLPKATPVQLPDPDRWPMDGCSQLGLVPEAAVLRPFAFAVLRQVTSCPERFPRRSGIPGKRPLFVQGRPGPAGPG